MPSPLPGAPATAGGHRGGPAPQQSPLIRPISHYIRSRLYLCGASRPPRRGQCRFSHARAPGFAGPGDHGGIDSSWCRAAGLAQLEVVPPLPPIRDPGKDAFGLVLQVTTPKPTEGRTARSSTQALQARVGGVTARR